MENSHANISVYTDFRSTSLSHVRLAATSACRHTPRGQRELYLAKSVCRDGKKSWSDEVYILAASLWNPDKGRTQNNDNCGGGESRSRDSKS